MGTYAPDPGVSGELPPCGQCGAAYRLHDGGRACPTAYPPESLEAPQRELEASTATEEVKRLGGGRVIRISDDGTVLE